jgi:SAM-dependent methyltransferase
MSQFKQLVRPCPICENHYGEVLHKQFFSLRSDSPLPSEYEVVFCSKCGFVYADTPANQAVYNEYYTLLSKYEDLVISSGTGIENYDSKRLEFTANSIKRVLPDCSSSILDMGCANGGLLRSLKQIGYNNILGIDPSKICNQHVTSLGINCVEGDIFSTTFTRISEKFDCIVLTHVLEHIYDLSKAIDNLSLKLNKNGILFIEVPDASRYSDYYIVPYYYIDCEHINHFDHASLSNLVSSKGFSQIETKDIEFKVTETKSYPAVYSVFQKTENPLSGELKPTDSTKESFVKFLEQSKSNDENDKIIKQLVNNQEPVIIWGAGQFALRLLANSELGKSNILGFIDSDSNKQGKKILNYTIFRPDYLLEINASVLICSALYSSDILKTIKEINNSIKVYSVK